MNKKRLILMFLMLCLVIEAGMASAMEIYIHNKPLSGKILTQGDEIFVPAAELKKLIRGELSWSEQDGSVKANGNETSIKIMRAQSTVYLPLKAVASAMGYKVTVNKATGIVDLYQQKALMPGTSPTPQPTQAAGQTQPATASPGDSKGPEGPDPLTIVEKSSMEDGKDPKNAGLRIYALVTNGRGKDANNVVATCMLLSDGKVYNQKVENVGRLAAGEKKEVIFYFPAGWTQQMKHDFTVKGD
ncbi:MAG: hypothetical protein RDV48_02280 [Candidatus Eremiobacteraeota bacterium]|nr:hypothetical protein [Candidatus Eremiobacteraeota bacterium]